MQLLMLKRKNKNILFAHITNTIFCLEQSANEIEMQVNDIFHQNQSVISISEIQKNIIL